MKASELRSKKVGDLHADLLELRQDQFKLRMQGRSGHALKYDRLKKNRRDIARIHTVLNEMKLGEGET